VTDLDGLRSALDGEVFDPDTAGYDDVRRPADVRYGGVRPRLVVRCRSDADVVAALGHARGTGLHIVPRGGGHCFAGRSSTAGMVLDLSGLDRVDVAGGGSATIGAGARLGRVYAELHRHRRTVPAGCGGTVGIAGLTLGGGIGLLGRTHGLTCDSLTGARVVLADGRVVDCDRDREAELFWALRGAGGGQFGVVTSLRFDTVPEPATTRFVLRWPRPPLGGLVETWQGWAPDAVDEVTANLTVVAEPGAPVRATVFGACLRPAAETRALVGELGALVGGDPEVDVQGGLPYSRLKDMFDGVGPNEPASGLRIRSELFTGSLRSETIGDLCAALAARGDGGPRALAFTALGGAYDRVPAPATAFAHRGCRFQLEHVGAVTSGWIDRSWAIAHADGSGRVYPNFPDPALEDWATAYHGENHARLAAAKRAYDPDRVFRFPQSL
jgi:FAD/FMN-containing dehydrogenase